MKIEKISKKDKELIFVIKGINPVVANTLRRLMVSEVPVLTIDEVTFIKNDSALFDEILAHRLGLVPFTTDLSSYDEKDKCSCKDNACAKCQLHASLKAKGPCTVYSESIQTQDPKIKSVYDKLPLVKLLKGQNLEIEAALTLGRGKEHAKYSPGIIHYRSYPTIEIKNGKEAVKCMKVCPKDVFTIEKNELKVKTLLNCDLCQACSDCSDNIKVSGSDTDFIFYIESFGQLSPEEILSTAINKFNEKLDEFATKLKEVSSGKIKKVVTKTKKTVTKKLKKK